MMKINENTFSRYLILLLMLLSAAEARGFDDSVITHIEYPDWFNENPFNDLPEILNESSANNKKGLFILFTTEGCSYCDRFIRESLGDSGIAIIMQDNFESIGLEILSLIHI